MRLAFWLYTAGILIANTVLLLIGVDTAVPAAALLVLLVLALLVKVNMISPPKPDERTRDNETFSMDYVSNKPNNEKNWTFVKRYIWLLLPAVVCLIESLIFRAV